MVMYLEQFYHNIGGDYKDMICRINNESLILKFVKKFPNDTSFALIEKSLVNKDYKSAFMNVHTLKGVSLNLSFKSLSDSCVKLTEYLRNSDEKVIDQDVAFAMFEDIKTKYHKIIKEISNLD